MNTRDPKPRPLTATVLTGVIAGVTRTVLGWLITLLTG
jgi:hypothetical protein